MNDVYLGHSMAGNFRPCQWPDKNRTYLIEKHDGILYLQSENEKIRLEPIDDEAKLLTNNFSNEIGEFNESIYQMKIIDRMVVVILYIYSEVQKLLLPSQKMSIHLTRDAEKQICSDSGYYGRTLDRKEEIVPYLSDLFINNKSIFVHLDAKNPNSFQMFGKKCRANVERERDSVYVITRFFKEKNEVYSASLTQLFGNIEFVLWEDAISITGNKQPLNAVKTNEVFKAWQEYMDFEKTIYENDIRDKKIIRYTSMAVNGDQLQFNLDEAVTEEMVQGIEFEFYSAYDGEEERDIPGTVEDLILLKQLDSKAGVFLGKPLGDCAFGKTLSFNIPNRGYFSGQDHYKGILYISDHSIKVEQRRRKKVLRIIESKENESSNIIMKLSDSHVKDDQVGTTYGPVNDKVLKKMFGTSNIQLRERYREAMYIALNTPDIALIQGPPGTGKTTLIKGLITRLNGMNKNYKILVSAEQHEALFNVVGKLSENNFIPPFVSSRKYDTDSDSEDNEKFEKNIRQFQNNFLSLCHNLLCEGNAEEHRSSKITEIFYQIQNIRDKNYAVNDISLVIDDLKQELIELGCYDKLESDFSVLNELIRLPEKGTDIEDMDFMTRRIIRKIDSQRTDKEVFQEDDGEMQLRDLQRLLSENDYDDFMLDKDVQEKMLSGDDRQMDSVFPRYVEYVDMLKSKFLITVTNEFDEDNGLSVKDAVENLSKKILEATRSSKKTFLDIVEDLEFKLGDIDNAADIIKNYTSIIGSTCAQADRSTDLVELHNSKYDYVIIDEAARANPLDLMIPMMMGTRVVLIGDHKQLPHYIESRYVENFKQEKDKYAQFDERLLTKSLFQIIYDNLEKAYLDGRIEFNRTIQIDEQHRMHPVIGSFISKEFYDDTIRNGEKTKDHVNDYHVFDGKNVVWLDVPFFRGGEYIVDHSYARRPEVDKIIQVISELVTKNPGRKLDIGVISFYKGQVGEIQKKLDESFPKAIAENISCNTVDSYQGQEFDIVIISGTRSNAYVDSKRSLGFIDCSPSRINVALSRAKRLLVMVGDSATYKRNSHFSNFIKYVKDVGYYGRS